MQFFAFPFSLIILGLVLVVPIIVILLNPPYPVSGMMLLLISFLSWMKLVSYTMVHRQLRKDKLEGKEIKEEILGINPDNIVCYPNNLTFQNLVYFMAAPTLCYQLNYPRSETIRWNRVLLKIPLIFFMLFLAIFMTEQWCLPVVKNSFHFFREKNWIGIIERTMKLSIPSLFIWLTMFYTFFHLWLNTVAELLRFGDREFYRDWWNATTMSYYWRTWNIPTHNWLLRHIYIPLIRHGYSKGFSEIIVFLFSAAFHELLISVPLHTFKLYFFFGMLIQIPSTYMGNYLKGTTIGNLIFWLSFCFLGQPIGVLLYSFDFASNLH